MKLYINSKISYKEELDYYLQNNVYLSKQQDIAYQIFSLKTVRIKIERYVALRSY